MIEAPGDYAWSSYRANGLGQAIKLCRPHRIYQALGETTESRTKAYRDLFAGHLDASIWHQIRQASNQGMALGNERFKQEIERLSGRRVSTMKRGPKPKSKPKDNKEFLL